MKKIISSFFLLVGFSLMVFGQNENSKNQEKDHYYQIGLNTGTLIKSVLGKEDDLFAFSSLTQETLTYKSRFGMVAFRAGIGFSFRKQEEDDNQDSEFSQSFLGLRMGFEKQKDISKNWAYYVGMDFKYNRSKFDFQFNQGSSNVNSFILAPLLGIQFRLTPHLLLQTESSINLFYSIAKNTTTFDFFPTPEPLFSEDSTTYGINITIPNRLFLVVEF